MSSHGPAGAGVVVVGVDGSEASRDALRWALDYARMAGAGVHALMAWELPDNFAWAAIPELDPEGDARRVLKLIVDELTGPYHDVPVRADVVEGHPRLVLARAAADARLLVVGSRGRGTFTGMLLGSVSSYCVHHATCPVVVIRHTAPEASSG